MEKQEVCNSKTIIYIRENLALHSESPSFNPQYLIKDTWMDADGRDLSLRATASGIEDTDLLNVHCWSI